MDLSGMLDAGGCCIEACKVDCVTIRSHRP